MVVWAGITMALSRPRGFLPLSIWNCSPSEQSAVVEQAWINPGLRRTVTLMVAPLIPAWTLREHCRVVLMLSTTTQSTLRPLSLDWRTRQWSRSTFLKHHIWNWPAFLSIRVIILHACRLFNHNSSILPVKEEGVTWFWPSLFLIGHF